MFLHFDADFAASTAGEPIWPLDAPISSLCSLQRQTSGIYPGAPAPLASPGGSTYGGGLQHQNSGPWRGSSGGGSSGEGGLLSHLKHLDAFPKQREEAAEFFQR